MVALTYEAPAEASPEEMTVAGFRAVCLAHGVGGDLAREGEAGEDANDRRGAVRRVPATAAGRDHCRCRPPQGGGQEGGRHPPRLPQAEGVSAALPGSGSNHRARWSCPGSPRSSPHRRDWNSDPQRRPPTDAGGGRPAGGRAAHVRDWTRNGPPAASSDLTPTFPARHPRRIGFNVLAPTPSRLRPPRAMRSRPAVRWWLVLPFPT